MLYRALADAVVVIHLLFIIFTVLGALLLLKWPKLMILHIPCAAWGVIVQVARNGVCPLTPLEKYFRELGDQAGYAGGFVDHYITSLIYVSDPPPWLHVALGIGVFVINATVYGIVIARWVKRQHERHQLEHQPQPAAITES
jgi:hypothetical protein